MNNSESRIVSRPAGGIWFGLGMMLFFFLGGSLGLILDPPKPSQLWWIVPTIVLSGIASFSVILTIARHRIIADESGLRWRGTFSNWKIVRWEEVSDFSLVGLKNSSHVVETSQGKLTFGGNDTRAEELAQFIAARATKAPVRTWLLPYEREDARFELVFATPLVSGRAFLLAWVPMTLVILAIIMALNPRDFALWQATRAADWGQTTWIYLAPYSLTAILLSSVPAIILAPIFGARVWNEIERVTATERGLRFEKSSKSEQILWSELRAVHLFNRRALNSRARFETTRGNWEVGWRTALRPIIERYAPKIALDSEDDETDLAPPVQLANGAHFYSLRTTGLRLMLRVFGAMAVFVVFMPSLLSIGATPEDLPRDDPRSIWLIFAPLWALCLYLWRLYQRGGIALNQIGVEVRGAWRDHFYRWDEIEERDKKLMARRGEKWVRLSCALPTIRNDELRAEIKRRAGQG